jgi:uncharacterized membrane protein
VSREGRRERIGCGFLLYYFFFIPYFTGMLFGGYYFLRKGNWDMAIIAFLCATVPIYLAAKPMRGQILFIIPYFICAFGGYYFLTKGNWSMVIIFLFVAVAFYLVTKRPQIVRNRQQTTTLPQTPETTPEQATPEQEEAYPLNISAESVAPADVPDLIRRLGELRDAGEITNGEYERRKAELLDRM